MATIIQPYNPWRENLAVGLLAPVINNLLQSSQQSAKNAKTAAILGEAYKLNDAPAVSSGIGGDAWVNSYFGGGRSGVGNSGMFGGLTGGGLPQGMNNGLTQFGNGFDQWLQAGNNAVNYGTPAVNNGLSLAKIAQVYGSDPQRFQSVSLDELTKAVSPYVAEAQEAQKRAALDAYYQNYRNMTPEEQVIMAANLLAQGYMPQGAFDSLMLQTHITPQQQVQNELSKAKLAQDYELKRAEMAQERNFKDRDFDLKDRELGEKQRQFNAELDYKNNNQPLVPFLGSNGTMYVRAQNSPTARTVVNENGDVIRVNPYEKAKETGKKYEKPVDIQTAEAIIERNNAEIKELEDPHNEIMNESTPEEKAKKAKRIALLQRETDEYEIWKSYRLLQEPGNADNEVLKRMLNQQIQIFHGTYGERPTIIPLETVSQDTVQQGQTPTATPPTANTPSSAPVTPTAVSQPVNQNNQNSEGVSGVLRGLGIGSTPINTSQDLTTNVQPTVQVQPSNVSQDLTQAVLNSSDVPPEGRVVVPEVPPAVSRDIDQRLNWNTGVSALNAGIMGASMPQLQRPPQTTPATGKRSNDELAAINAMHSLGGKTPQTLTFDNMLKLWDNLRTGKTEFPRGVQIRSIKDLENYLRSQGFIITAK